MHNLGKNVKIVSGSTLIASSTADINGTVIDTDGFASAAFLFTFNGFTTQATVDCHVEGSNDSTASSDMVDLEDSGAAGTDATQSAKFWVDCGRLKYRYIQPVVTKATAASACADITGFLYNPINAKVTQPSTLVVDTAFIYDATTGASTGS